VHSIENEAPTGTVVVAVDGNVICTITLDNGTGTCNLVFNTAGTIPVTATYHGDSEYLPSSTTSAHEVLASPPTPSITPSPTLTHTPTVPPTIASTPVVGCSNIAVPAGQTITFSGKTMYLNINNPMPYDVTIGDVFVRWNYLQGYSGRDLRLVSAQMNTQVFWTGDIHAPSYSPPLSATVTLPANTASRITFTFDKLYTRTAGEQIQITFSTPGCEDHVINVIR
jgi:hypothetical protein